MRTSAMRELNDVLLGLNRAEALARAGAMQQMAEQARRTLALLERDDGEFDSNGLGAGLEEGCSSPEVEEFRVEWDRVAAQHEGQPAREIRAKRLLLRWRLHILLAEATGDLIHYYEAALARAEQPITQAALGCALARAGRFQEAAPHLRRAVGADPFDRAAARALFDVLGAIGDELGRRRLAESRRLLHQRAPAQVPAEAWFTDLAVATPRAGAPPTGTQSAGARPRVSLCMIVKNEEHNLPTCLESVAGLLDEVIVVDTGSTDRTKEVAAHFGARVVDFAWVDSFAAARNEALRHATGSWIFWLDADDRLDQENCGKLRELFAGLQDDNAAYVMKCQCLSDQPGGAVTVVDHVRLFRNDPRLRWKYRVHEQILLSVRRLGGEVRWSDVIIHHTGYQDSAIRVRKLERDLRLLQLENAENPDDPFTLFNLGSVYQELRQPGAALPLLRRSLELSHSGDSIVRKLHALIAQCHRHQGQPAEALASCHAGRGHYPDDVELLFLEGLALRDLGDRAGAEAAWLHLLEARDVSHFASIDAGLKGHKVRQNLAVIYQEQGRLAEAEAQWRAALVDHADFLPAWLGLADLYLSQGRWLELAQVQRKLDATPQWASAAAATHSRRQLADTT